MTPSRYALPSWVDYYKNSDYAECVIAELGEATWTSGGGIDIEWDFFDLPKYDGSWPIGKKFIEFARREAEDRDATWENLLSDGMPLMLVSTAHDWFVNGKFRTWNEFVRAFIVKFTEPLSLQMKRLKCLRQYPGETVLEYANRAIDYFHLLIWIPDDILIRFYWQMGLAQRGKALVRILWTVMKNRAFVGSHEFLEYFISRNDEFFWTEEDRRDRKQYEQILFNYYRDCGNYVNQLKPYENLLLTRRV